MKNDLEDIIRQEILDRGPIPFARYQELCLYQPGLGYYQRAGSPTGKSGDFYTAPHVHELFGRTVGQWIRTSAADDLTAPMTIVELGPGNGQLAQDILDSWEGSLPEYILVESGEERRTQLESRFTGRSVRVVPPDRFDDLDPFTGVVLANEFFDALPVTVYERRETELTEVWVDLADNLFVEILRPASGVGLAAARFLDGLPDGSRTELADGWATWLERIFRRLEKGIVLAFDYGDTADGLHVPWRAGGTLRCFRSHQVDTEPYEAPGEKDITASVNFTVLEDLARETGFTPDRLLTQASFLIRAGILELLAEEMARLEEKKATALWLTVKNLVHDEDGMGEIFKAMVLRKGSGV
ncbi:MAG: SAM-dependent methyltransferase [bacterium]|nr:SAM-dependent methyltransferase [bacterium]MDT8396174.1 SAM-dependent methyltransferase [bacterium]